MKYGFLERFMEVNWGILGKIENDSSDFGYETGYMDDLYHFQQVSMIRVENVILQYEKNKDIPNSTARF